MDADKLQAYRDKRDAARTPEPVPAELVPAGEAPAGEAPAGENGDGGTFVIQEHHARRLHWDFRLERDGVLVSWALPKGVPDDPAVNHLAVHTEDHPLEYGGFEGEIPRGEYGAGAVTIWDSGRYETLKWAPKEVKVRLHGRRVTGEFALFQTKGNQWMIHRDRQPLPTGIRPMLATSWATPPPDDGNWALEMKWDGVRALAFVERGRVRLMSRTERDITVAYPELASLGSATAHKQLLLDGEIVVFGAGRLARVRGAAAAHARHRRVAGENAGRPEPGHLPGVRPAAAGRQAAAGRGVLRPPRAARFDWAWPGLTGRLRRRSPARTSRPCSRSRPNRAWKAWWPSGSTRSTCRACAPTSGARSRTTGARRWSWSATSPGKGNRTGQVGSLLIGVNDSSGLIYAGHVGTGFSVETLRMLGERLEPLRRSDSPYRGPVPPEHARTAVWVEPRLVIDVTFDRWTRAGRMRAPVYKGLRDDKDPSDVIREP